MRTFLRVVKMHRQRKGRKLWCVLERIVPSRGRAFDRGRVGPEFETREAAREWIGSLEGMPDR